MLIALGGVSHETNTFAPRSTTLDDFVQPGPFPGLLEGEAILEHFRGTKTIVGGVIDVADELEFELAPLIWTFATPSGTVDHEAYEWLKRQLVTALEAAGWVDGLLLDLHGAMVTTECEDAEGDLLAAVRYVFGRGVPCVTTLDLHANVTAAMVKHADVLVGFDSYPHVDMHERGVEAARILASLLNEGWKATAALCQLPLITAPPKQCTLFDPMQGIIAKARELEQRDGVVNVTVAGGFPFADIWEAGTSVVVTTRDNDSLARELSEELGQFIWERRDAFAPELLSVESAVSEAMATDGLIILADTADNPGGGGACDGTAILAELIKQNAQSAVVAVIADPEAVRQCAEAGVGATVSLRVGGRTDDQHGAPVEVTGTVVNLTDGSFITEGPMGTGVKQSMGRAAVVRIGGVELVLTERRIQARDTALLRSVGIAPEACKIIVLKSSVHFRAAFGPIASRLIEVDGPGCHSPNLFKYRYEKLRRPLYPLQPEATWDDRKLAYSL